MAVGTFVLSAVSACTKVDDTLGQGFIPGGNDKLTLHIDTLGLGEGEAITACQVYYDSIGLAGHGPVERSCVRQDHRRFHRHLPAV